MSIEQIIRSKVSEAVQQLYKEELNPSSVQIQNTRKDVEGDLTVVVFPFLRFSKKSPEQTAEELGKYLSEKVEEVDAFEVVKGFLNLTISVSYWLGVLADAGSKEKYGFVDATEESPQV
ncbi:MAG: hypothetical protein MI740_14435, partial [Halanaerobiales bacterium]|nr:hypothetical protein [Halanaerobiales bacterium]